MVSDIIRPEPDDIDSLCDCGDGLSARQGAKCGNCIAIDLSVIDRRSEELEAIVRDLAAATWPSQREALYDRARAWVLDHPVSGTETSGG